MGRKLDWGLALFVGACSGVALGLVSWDLILGVVFGIGSASGSLLFQKIRKQQGRLSRET
jgi:hypothetical protein